MRCTNADVPRMVCERYEFSNSTGSLRGERFDRGLASLSSFGHLPAPWRDLFTEDRSVEGVFYVVFSYETPIMWKTSQKFVLPDVKYSRTTSGHQNWVRRGLRGECRRILTDLSEVEFDEWAEDVTEFHVWRRSVA